jgi:DinB family protein
MQYVRQAGTDPSFLLKALSEASGELTRAFYGLSPRDLAEPGCPPDDGWSLLAIPYHLRETERGALRQYQAIIAGDDEMPHVDLDDIPLPEDLADADEDDLLEEFHYLRRRTSYLLWDLMPGEWERGARHPYLGRRTILELTREMYRHDLEHLWQARRMMDAILSAPG